MAIDKSIKLPQKFREQYRNQLAARLGGSAGILGAAALLCNVIDFSGSRYPAMGIVMVMACGFVLACLIVGIHRILFRTSWSGTITDIDADYHIRTKNRGLSKKFIVTLTIDCGGKEPKKFELLHEDRNGENKYYTEAPYKVGDTVVFLRGMKYPLRYGVETEDMLTLFVCPYCGDINKAERDTCYKCGKFLVK